MKYNFAINKIFFVIVLISTNIFVNAQGISPNTTGVKRYPITIKAPATATTTKAGVTPKTVITPKVATAPKAAVTTPKPTTTPKVTTPKEAVQKPVAPKVAKIKPAIVTPAANGVILKKDGTPDKRYKAAQHLKKDGTPDKRYKDNN